MTDRFDGVWRKVDRAKHHLEDLERQIQAFWDTQPYEIETQGDPKTGPGSYRIKGVPKTLPKSIPVISGDAVHNLRAAFDHLAFAAVPQPPSFPAAFPVWRKRTPTSAEWEGLVKGKLNGASSRLLRAVVALEAYHGGAGEWLWALDELDNIDKHRLLITVASANTGIVIDAMAQMRALNVDPALDLSDAPPMEYVLRPAEWTRLEPSTELFTVLAPEGFPHDADVKFTFDVTLGEPEMLRGEPIVPTLRGLTDESEGLLQRLVALA